MLHKNVYLQSLAYELPSQVVTTNSICERLTPTFQRLGIPSSWVCALSGVNERRVWGEGESLADIAARIARKVVEDSGIPLERIGCVVCTSVSKEFIEPSMACMVHSALGLPETTSSYDISNACLAFLNGISQMGQLIDQGAIEAALIVDVENSRQVIENTVRQLEDPRIDLATFSKCFAGLTLGSGAVAALITNRQLAPQGHKVVGHVAFAATVWGRSPISPPTRRACSRRVSIWPVAPGRWRRRPWLGVRSALSALSAIRWGIAISAYSLSVWVSV